MRPSSRLVDSKEFGNQGIRHVHKRQKGYRQFFKWVKTDTDKSVENEWLFCGEDTGSWSLGLSKWLYGKGLDIWIENAYSIKHSSGIQRVKSDKADSSMIAEYAWRHQDKAVLFEPLSESLSNFVRCFFTGINWYSNILPWMLESKTKEAARSSEGYRGFIRHKSKHLMSDW